MIVPWDEATQENAFHNWLNFRRACFQRIPVMAASQDYQVYFGYPWMVYFDGRRLNSLTSHRLVKKHCVSLVEDFVRYLEIR